MSETPFISGCYIVKDEEQMLAASLRALAPFVDELVVYDTGSTDRTCEIARELGAAVVEGYWDENFGAARNRADEHCRGEWIVVMAADEVAEGDPRALRRELHLAEAELVQASVISASFGEGGVEHTSWTSRVFRRTQCRWRGALHEQIVGRWGDITTARTGAIAVRHFGYAPMVVAAKDKAERNLSISRRELERARAAGVRDLRSLQVNYGRSAALAGDYALALKTLSVVMDEAGDPRLGIQAGHTAVRSATMLHDARTARRWLTLMRGWGESENVCLALEGRLELVLGDPVLGEEVLRSVRDDVDHDGDRFEASSCIDDLVRCVAAQERYSEAVDIMLPHVATGLSDIDAAFAVFLAAEVEDGLERLAAAVPPRLIKLVVGQVFDGPSVLGERFLDALWRAGHDHRTLLAALDGKATGLAVERALVWSLRLREEGFGWLCPLRTITRAEDVDLRSRILAGACLVEIGERDVLAGLEPLLEQVSDDDSEDLLRELIALTPRFAATLQLA